MSDASGLIAELLAKYQELPADQRAEIDKFVDEESARTLWFPTPGPQLDAINCKADVLLYGGSGGSGKSDLMLGAAFTEHDRTLIIRKFYVDLTALIDRAKEINGTDKGFNGSPPPRLKTVNGKLIDFGGIAKPGDEEHWQGQAHDLLCVDEVVQCRENQIRFLMGWVRSGNKGQRKRVILASNPPTGPSGDWIIPMFGPWLDPTWPKNDRAKHGELRWVVTDQDETGKSTDKWVDGPDTKIDSGKKNPDGSTRYLIPTSRTFIPGKLSDNPFLSGTGYEATLDALPEPLRSAIRDGNFMAAREDDPWQLFPTEWLRAAQARWKPIPDYELPQCAIGVDAARGGRDNTVLAPRHDGWYAPLIKVPGKLTPHGTDVAALVVKHRRNDSVIILDCGESNGAKAFAHLQENDIDVVSYIGMEKSTARTAERKLGFTNKRSESYWRFREALDPGQDGGSSIALPDDPDLISELSAPHFELRPNGIQVMPKKDVVQLLGRSPDKADAVIMAWCAGPKAITHAALWRADMGIGTIGGGNSGKRQPKVDFGPRRSNFGPRRR